MCVYSNVVTCNGYIVTIYLEWFPASIYQLLPDCRCTFLLTGVGIHLQPRGLECGMSKDATVKRFNDNTTTAVRTLYY